jgi:aminoglycoside phosphotransferase (APT) family kinase protein
MQELSAENVLDYLRRTERIGAEPAQAEMLGGGVSNVVLRVKAGDRLFVLKQSRPQLRTKAAWFSDLERIYREQQVMEVLAPLLPAGVVPAVLFDDRENYLFAMQHAPLDAMVWKGRLLAGDIDLSMGELAGKVLGKLHEATATNRRDIERFGDATVFVQLRVDPFYRRVSERYPDLGPLIAPLIDEMALRRDALCHGDYSPKNILAHAAGFMLVDYETAYLGDPTMDLGFFLSHLLLKAVHRPMDRARFFELTRAFWRGYAAAVSFRPLAELMHRGIGHLGVCLLARVDGTSPVDYLAEDRQREAVRRIGRRLLTERPRLWEDVTAVAESNIAALESAT